VLLVVVLFSGKIRRGWKGDHPPRHVHVYRDGRLIVKWDLEERGALRGESNARIRKLLAELEKEGLL